MTEKELIEKFLTRRGWGQWYHKNNWVHSKTVKDPAAQDYTNYGMDLQSAFIYEVEGMPSFRPMGLPEISKYLHETNNEVLEYYFGKK